MKIKEGFMLRNVAGSAVVVPLGKAAAEFNGMINLNGVGAFLWEQLQQETTVEQLQAALLENYDVTPEKAAEGVAKFVAELEKADFLEQ